MLRPLFTILHMFISFKEGLKQGGKNIDNDDQCFEDFRLWMEVAWCLIVTKEDLIDN